MASPTLDQMYSRADEYRRRANDADNVRRQLPIHSSTLRL